MTTSLFICHVYEDRQAVDTMRQWAAAGKLGLDVVVTGESEDVRQHGSAAIRRHLSPKIQGASVVMVLIGNNTHNHEWIEYEVSHALSSRKLLVVVRLPHTTGAPPRALQGIGIIAMDPSAIGTALKAQR